MSMHKQPPTEIEKSGLIRHGLTVDQPSQNSDCFRLGVAWALMQEFTCINIKQPTNESAVFWVVGGEAGAEPILARLNNYKTPGGRVNCWQTLTRSDFSMLDTKWLEIKKPITKKAVTQQSFLNVKKCKQKKTEVSMKDHEIAALVNEITKQVKNIYPDAPQCLREVVSKAVKSNIPKSAQTKTWDPLTDPWG
jgi:hypothetical protein